jgi:TPR repeat protein
MFPVALLPTPDWAMFSGDFLFSGEYPMARLTRTTNTLMALLLFIPFRAGSQEKSPGAPQQINVLELAQQAQNGDATAQLLLGRTYRLGTGLLRDYTQAAKWYALAAAQGLGAAQFELGYLYENAKGVPRDYRRAADLYRAAADQGNATAANNLGTMYERGLGMPRDLPAAIHWYRNGAEHGDPTAQCNLASAYFTGSGVPRDRQEAAKWFRAAAEQGLPAAEKQSLLHVLHRHGGCCGLQRVRQVDPASRRAWLCPGPNRPRLSV